MADPCHIKSTRAPAFTTSGFFLADPTVADGLKNHDNTAIHVRLAWRINNSPGSRPGVTSQNTPKRKALLATVPSSYSGDSEIMTAAISTIQNPANGDFEAVEGELGHEMLTRRLKRRRQVLVLAAASHLINIALLVTFAAAGTVSPAMVAAFTLAATASIGFFLVLSESGVTDRWQDHHFTLPYTVTSAGLLLAFICLAPGVGIVFLCALFLVANVISLRATPRQGLISWAALTISVAAVYLLADLPMQVPFATPAERLATLLTFSLTIARSMFIGIFANILREVLHRRRIELEIAYKRIEELAELDELTGSFNRRCIMRMLDDEILRTHRSKTECTVALIDLDWFKRINDNFGHPTGDEVLRTFAITMFANIRSIDKFGRYGGEEFMLVLPDTPHDMAVQMLDRLRLIIAALDWSAFSDGLSVTISAGVATLVSDETAEMLLARADSALYAAKHGGRNRIASA
jgi:diguanylate cyclase (GGDEF)-like protein